MRDKPDGREVECTHCGESQTTGAAPGRKTRCKACGERFRVPMREASSARELTCEGCGAEFSSSAPPGRRAACPECGHETRVPLAEVSTPRTLTCPRCARENPRGAPTCQACSHPFARLTDVVEAGEREDWRELIGWAVALAVTVGLAQVLTRDQFKAAMFLLVGAAVVRVWWRSR